MNEALELIPDLWGPEAARRWVLEWRSTEWLTSNDRGHWGPPSRLTRSIRATARLLATAAKVPPLERVHYLVVVHNPRDHPDKRGPRDAGNLAPTVKALIDGITDAGVTPDDSNRYLVEAPWIRAGAPVAGICMLLRIVITEATT